MDKLTLSLRRQSDPTSNQNDENNQEISASYQQIVETITTITNINNEELENLRNENDELNQIIAQLKKEIEILSQENANLKYHSKYF